MKYELVRYELNRTNRNFLITIIIIIGIFANVFMTYANEIYNFTFGPFQVEDSEIIIMDKKEFKDKIVPFDDLSEDEYNDMDTADIEKIKANDYTIETAILSTKAFIFKENKFFVLIKGKPIQIIEGFTKYVDFNFSAYALLPYADGLILVKATKADIEKGEFKGVFAPMTESLEMDIKPLIKNEHKDIIYENVFYAMGSFEITTMYNIFLVLSFFILIAYLIFKLVRRYLNPKYHPFYKKISIYGDQDAIVKKINDEYLLDESKVYKKEIATPTFMIKRRFWRTLITLNEQNINKDRN